MKVNKKDKDISGDFNLSRDELDKAERHSLFGVPGRDGKGTYPYFFNVRIRENQFDLIAGIRELAGDWYISNAEVQRAIIAAGTYIILCVLKHYGKNVEILMDVLSDMGFLNKHKRMRTLKEDLEKIKQDIISSDIPNPTKIKAIEFSNEIAKKIQTFEKSVKEKPVE